MQLATSIQGSPIHCAQGKMAGFSFLILDVSWDAGLPPWQGGYKPFMRLAKGKKIVLWV